MVMLVVVVDSNTAIVKEIGTTRTKCQVDKVKKQILFNILTGELPNDQRTSKVPVTADNVEHTRKGKMDHTN